jgi:putative chitinase
VLTGQQLQSIMPSIPTPRREALLPFLRAAMAEFAIETPARVAAFVAQLAHESGQFLFMEEIWGPTQAQRRYEPVSTLAATLGNTESGDGKRFKGRGPIQITGRANYRRFGDLLGLDLVSNPARAAHPELAFRIAGLFWSKKGLSELADRATDEAFREITRRINGGFNGLDDRRKFYAVARTVLGVVDQTITRGTARSGPEAGDEPAFDRGAEAIRRHARRRDVTATKTKAKAKAKAKTKKKGEKKNPKRKNSKKRKTTRTAARTKRPRAR